MVRLATWSVMGRAGVGGIRLFFPAGLAFLLVAGLTLGPGTTPAAPATSAERRWDRLQQHLQAYRTVLDKLRQQYGQTYRLPPVSFFLFGMGPRDKLLYQAGELREALTGKVLHRWKVAEELIVPSAYTVALKTADGDFVWIAEDESGVWLEQGGRREALTRGPVRLPEFADHAYGPVLRVLHQEVLVNIVQGRPVPNFFVYPRPWYRDAALMAMVLARTGNLPAIQDWVRALREPYDRNNGGETEPDNLGEVLYLISCVSDASHPLVPTVQQELKRWEKKKDRQVWIAGRTDFGQHPVYQTLWAKFGLKSLGLPDPYTVPRDADSYAALAWWAERPAAEPLPAPHRDERYPYLVWASRHCRREASGPLSDRDYPLTWEAQASQARYEGMERIDKSYTQRRLCAPHTWHAAEAFLHLLESSPKTPR
jgi:hypothetical protein